MSAGSRMSRNILLILADAAEAKAVRRSLANSRDGPFKVEWVNRCAAAVERLGDPQREQVAAIMVGLFLPDSQGIETFDTLFRERPDVPILVLSRLRDENVARLAVQRGAQDYLLEERLDGYSMVKALASMLERSANIETLFLDRERAQVTLASIGDALEPSARLKGYVPTLALRHVRALLRKINVKVPTLLSKGHVPIDASSKPDSSGPENV